MTDRPGGWVEGIGWVALYGDLLPGDVARVAGFPEWGSRDVSWWSALSSQTVCIVTRWADGSTPEPPKRLPDVTELPEWQRAVEVSAAYDGAASASAADSARREAWSALRSLIAAVDSRGEN